VNDKRSSARSERKSRAASERRAKNSRPPSGDRTGGRLAGRVALVTGGGGGIGRAVAERLAREGARVEIAEIDAARGAEAADAIAQQGGRARAEPIDVCEAGEVGAWIDGVLARERRIDVLVNNVGHYLRSKPFAESDPEHWAALQRINLDHVFIVTRAALPALRAHHAGSIVNVASVEGIRGYPPDPVYGAYKAAVVHFTKCLALELAPDVRVNAIAPDLTQSLQVDYERWVAAAERHKWSLWTPLGRPGTGADQADVVGFLASDDARFVTGCVIPTDGGSLAAGGWFRSARAGRWVNRPYDP
jgi:NAD(P)-dependent dehydrogenase (short-subunit alcohol dehydrogenase family)